MGGGVGWGKGSRGLKGVWGGWVWAKIINKKIINTIFVFIIFDVGEGVATAVRDLWGVGVGERV